jgi:hypothetical protein
MEIPTFRLTTFCQIRDFIQADLMSDHSRQQSVVLQPVRETLVINKQGSHRFHMERFNLKIL